jgi:hypothetical protein
MDLDSALSSGVEQDRDPDTYHLPLLLSADARQRVLNDL